MEITVDQGKLAKALAVVSQVAAGSRASLPILSNVLIRVEDGKTMLTATNLDMAVVDFLPVADAKDGVITVPAKLLSEFASNLPKGQVKIVSKETRVTVSLDKYHSTMNGAYADDFPELPEIDEEKATKFTIPVDEFKNDVNEVIFAASNDTSRPALTGIYFNTANNSLFIAATDGYRLTERKLADKVEAEVKAIVPTTSLQEVMRSIDEETDEVVILFDEAQVVFRLGETEVISKLIDGVFPEYRRLIPESSQVEVVLDRSELIRVAKLAELFARQSNGTIVIETKKADGAVTVSSVANEMGENASEIQAEVSDDTSVSVNARYFIDAINALEEDKLQIGISGKAAPVVIRNEKSRDYVHIVMPLRG